MSLEDELIIKNLKKELSEKENTILELKEQISDMKFKVNETQNDNIKIMSDLKAQLAETKLLEMKVKNNEILEERIHKLSAEKKSLETQLLESRTRNEDMLKERETILKEKAQISESKNEILQKISELQLEIKENDLKFADLQSKFKEISSQNLTIEMDLDKSNKKIETLENEKLELAKKIEELEITLDVIDEGEVFSTQGQVIEGTGIIINTSSLMDFFRNNIRTAKSNIRIVLPDIHDIERFNLIEDLHELPKNVTVSIAAKIDDIYSDDFVRELKKNFQLINYEGENIFALNIDSAKIGIGTTNERSTLGIYTDSMALIDLFKSTIMAPFLRGRKVM
jgi:myosin heavy subunit